MTKPVILIVDDNAVTRYAMRRVIERQGYHVLEAGTGQEGRAHIAADEIDVVVLDVNLPDDSGFDIVRDLRADPRTALLPIIQVSAAAIHTRDVIVGLEAGADSYLIHPVDPGVLIATVRTLLRVRAAEEELRAMREAAQRERLENAHTQLEQEISAHQRTEAQLMQVQKMDALGQLTGGIAHDFNNLLTGILTSLSLMLRDVEAGRTDTVRGFAEAASDSARRAAALTHRLLAFARQQPLDARAVDINARISSLGDLLRRTIGERVSLTLDLDPAARIARVDANQLENAVLNLVVNARDAMPDGGHVRISTRRAVSGEGEDVAAGEYVELTVVDDGVGIPADVLDRVFEPFFTTKPIGQGTGLGLAMTYGFARQSGGDARIASVPGQGTTVTLRLPSGDGLALPMEIARVGLLPKVGNGKHILFVEDSDSVREVTTLVLVSFGYRCTAVDTVEKALALLENERFDLLLTDVGLPGMDGRQLADVARACDATLPVLFLTGYSRHSAEVGSFLGHGMDLMTKPYEVEHLLSKVGQMVRVV
ncbi:response regulator [Lysobacter sp. 2RAF19]